MATKRDEEAPEEDGSKAEASDASQEEESTAPAEEGDADDGAEGDDDEDPDDEDPDDEDPDDGDPDDEDPDDEDPDDEDPDDEDPDDEERPSAREPEPLYNTQTLVLGGLVIVLILGGGYYWWSNQSSLENETPEITADDSERNLDELGGAGEGQLTPGLEGLGGLPQRPSPIPAPPDVAAPPENATRTESGIAYRVLTPGTGTDHPSETDRVTVHYSGWTTDGQLFDSSHRRGEPVTLGLDGVIPGWTEAVQLMVAGESRRLWVPQDLAYAGRPGAPPGMLVFDIELISFEAPPPPPETPPNVAGPPRNAERTESGLASLRLEEGTGDRHPTEADVVQMHLDGWMTNGELFDSTSSRGQPLTMPLARFALVGLREGIQLMVAGEKRRFWVPEELAFAGQQGAPPGMLVFDVQLIEIVSMPPGLGGPPGGLPPGNMPRPPAPGRPPPH